ncbi:MAG: polysaccharide biosynthesis tyrosine autokinase, partial [Clostridia bacterium]|nr:polysaccharide biosynthesis tyrosine autokinase [Clostridia bacterium]
NKTTQLTTRALQSMVKVQNEEEGSSFTVKVSSTNPKQAIELLRIYEALTPAYLATHSRYVDVVLTTYGEQATTPDSPNTKLNILLGGMLLTVVTYLIFFLISFLDKTVYEEETIKEQFTVPLIGTIPEWARTPEESKELARSRRSLKRDLRLGLHSDRIVKGRLLCDTTPFSITEAFKTLRTNLIYVDTNGAKTPVFGIVSDLSGAGKSMIASNVAIGFAQLGKRVLLIDGDMRCPIQHRNFGLSRHKWGLSEALAGISSNPLQECIQQTSYEGLDLMTCGRIPPNPNELLSSNQMKELLESAKEVYDYILIDLPPVCATSDASVLAPLLNGYVLVARSAYSNLTALHDAFDLLNAVNANVVGIVLNDINPRQNSRYRGAGGRYSQYYPGAANRDEVTEGAPAVTEAPALPEQEQE